ncbi:Peroxisome biogenesis protein 22 [Porphyridium purpureum]|uniref:Peroxisome biogenesis protein 22 n=1 Tax=Porphyridium purpureum TaxID=35688 RepID=A0A5J4Z1W5_PORPP|nr:Peroxisome biogenesis protein 22 [Porphyridium purpureum]|eukprot:POR3548..scf208_2
MNLLWLCFGCKPCHVHHHQRPNHRIPHGGSHVHQHNHRDTQRQRIQLANHPERACHPRSAARRSRPAYLAVSEAVRACGPALLHSSRSRPTHVAEPHEMLTGHIVFLADTWLQYRSVGDVREATGNMGRMVAALISMLRGYLQRNGPAPLLLLAVAAAALAYTIRAARQKRRAPPGGGSDAGSARALIDVPSAATVGASSSAATPPTLSSRARGTSAAASAGGVVGAAPASSVVGKKGGKVVNGGKGLIKLPHVQSITVGCCLDDASLFVYDRAAHSCELNSEAAEAIEKLAGTFNLYMIVRVDTDQDEQLVRLAFEKVGLFTTGAAKHKLLFCETLMGRASIARQIEPELHMDSSTIVTESLFRFIRYAAVFGPNHEQDIGHASASASNLFRYPTFHDLLTL